MRSTKPKRGKRAYQCARKPEGSAGVSIAADDTEQEVVTQVLATVASPTIPEESDADADAEALIGANESQLEELARDWAARVISRAEWLAARNALQERLERGTPASGSGGHHPPASVADLIEHWPGLTFGQRRASLRAVIDRVEIQAAAVRGRNRFDAERVAVVWRT